MKHTINIIENKIESISINIIKIRHKLIKDISVYNTYYECLKLLEKNFDSDIKIIHKIGKDIQISKEMILQKINILLQNITNMTEIYIQYENDSSYINYDNTEQFFDNLKKKIYNLKKTPTPVPDR